MPEIQFTAVVHGYVYAGDDDDSRREAIHEKLSGIDENGDETLLTESDVMVTSVDQIFFR